jgi:hypothetical protein
MIKYALRKNQLATEEPNFVANVTCMASKTLDDLVAKMVAEGKYPPHFQVKSSTLSDLVLPYFHPNPSHFQNLSSPTLTLSPPHFPEKFNPGYELIFDLNQTLH